MTFRQSSYPCTTVIAFESAWRSVGGRPTGCFVDNKPSGPNDGVTFVANL